MIAGESILSVQMPERKAVQLLISCAESPWDVAPVGTHPDASLNMVRCITEYEYDQLSLSATLF